MDEPGRAECAPDGEWVWREDPMRAFLASIQPGETAFVSGCTVNQTKFYLQFDAIELLTAPAAALTERLATRTNNPYGSARKRWP